MRKINKNLRMSESINSKPIFVIKKNTCGNKRKQNLTIPCINQSYQAGRGIGVGTRSLAAPPCQRVNTVPPLMFYLSLFASHCLILAYVMFMQVETLITKRNK